MKDTAKFSFCWAMLTRLGTRKTNEPSIYMCFIGLCYVTNGLSVFKKLLGSKV